MGLSYSKASQYFGEKVRALRLKDGVSQETLAYKAGIERSYMGQIERGIANPSFKKILSIANALGVSVKELTP
jgi:transcriptional regulator with XRE-family HTH domain